MSQPPVVASRESAQYDKAVRFRALHEQCFVLANAWDGASAALLSRAGFAALGTTSAGLAHALGRPDGANRVDRATTLANAAVIVAASNLPVSADLESGFAENGAELRATYLEAADIGLVGGSIEDATGDPDRPIRDRDEAVDRVAEVVAALRELPFPFTLTARAENFLYGVDDLDDTIDRLVAYRAAGADVVYAPGLPDADAVRRLCATVAAPVNVLAGNPAVGTPPIGTVVELAALGARRVSLGSLLHRLSLGALDRAGIELAQTGRLPDPATAVPYLDLNTMLS